MEANELQQQMLRTAKFDRTLDNILLNCALGLSGETGEINDIIKKVLFHSHPLTDELHQKLLDEIGDVAWYLAYLSAALSSDFETIFQRNIAKLQKRYPNGFNTADSLNRSE
jgi:NTP pyrophosphatase (non-canonical NTP hydrolase)